MNPIQATQDRAAFESQWTAQLKPTPPTPRTGADLKDLFHKPDDPNLDVRKSSITSLMSWAHHRQLDALRQFKGQDREFQAMYWDGYKKAIEEILEMENQ